MQTKIKNDDYVMIRSYSAGVFAGTLVEKEGDEVTLKNARRIWYWEGAASLSELAMKGPAKQDNCKFPCEVDLIILPNVCEIILCTKKAKARIDKVPIWTADE